MQVPLEITFRGVNDRENLEEMIREKVEKLERVCDHIISCHVAVEQLQKSHKKGNPYHVRIDLKVPPGHELVVTRDSNESVYAVLKDAFEAGKRQLQELNDRQHNRVKTHAKPEPNVDLAPEEEV